MVERSPSRASVVAPTPPVESTNPAVDLYWIPLGAGSRIVETSGRLFEAFSAMLGRRERCDLYHTALRISVAGGCFSIEQAPVPDEDGRARGVVAVGPVGTRPAGRLRMFRYEVRCWRDGIIPDLAEAVDSPIRLATDEDTARRILDLLPAVPTPVWGRDELSTGEMWNSNSVIAWVLTRSGVDLDSVEPPRHGRAPGWGAGRIVAEAAEPARPVAGGI